VLKASEVADSMSRDVVSNGREFVWGLDDSQKDFVRTWIGANPDRVILSDDQRKAAVAAAGKYSHDEDEPAE
jgi:hypothetical protein